MTIRTIFYVDAFARGSSIRPSSVVKPIQLGMLVVLLSWMSCRPQLSEKQSDDPVLAQVYNKSLVLSDIPGLVPIGTAAEDSIHMVRSFVERWVREALLMHEAEKYIRADMDVDRLVRDYRASLILNNYEREILNYELDSVVSDAELTNYLESNQESFRLRQGIVRFYLIKLRTEASQVDTILSWWNTEPLTRKEGMVQVIQSQADFVHLYRESWENQTDLKKRLPKGGPNTLKAGSHQVIEKNGYLYLLKIFETADAGELPPMSFVRNQIEKVILHRRKLKLIEDKKEALYQEEIKGKNVKVFTN